MKALSERMTGISKLVKGVIKLSERSGRTGLSRALEGPSFLEGL